MGTEEGCEGWGTGMTDAAAAAFSAALASEGLPVVGVAAAAAALFGEGVAGLTGVLWRFWARWMCRA